MTNRQGEVNDGEGDVVKRRDLLFKPFTRQRYEAICVHKTALYTFTLPVLGNSGSAVWNETQRVQPLDVVDFADIL